MDIKATQETNQNMMITKFEAEETISDYANFHIIPAQIMADKEISANEKLVYGFLFTFNHQHKDLFGSNEFIARSCGLEEQTVANILVKLDKRGLIKRIYKNDNPREGREGILLQVNPFTSSGKPLYRDREHTISITKSFTKDISKKLLRTFSWFKKNRFEIIERAEQKFPNLDVNKGYEVFVEQVEAKGYKYINHEAAYHSWLRGNLNGQFNKS